MFESGSEKKKTIAILGGSFDPPTLAHVQIAAEVYNTHGDIDEVWIVPCGDGRGDKSLKTEAKHRLKMLEIILLEVLGEEVPIKINDIEIRNHQYYPTWKLLQELKEVYSDCNFLFCVGTDLVATLKSWDYGEQLVNETEFIVLNRVGYNPDKSLYPKHYRTVDTVIEGSSTRIRDRIKDQIEAKNKINLGINGLTVYKVIKYIIANKLYQQ